MNSADSQTTLLTGMLLDVKTFIPLFSTTDLDNQAC